VPTYEYACTACGHRLEAVQRFTDEALTECPECAGALRKVYGAVGIVLKGSGFYKTDSRAAAGNGSGAKSTATESSASSASSGESSGADSGAKKESSDSGSGGSGKESSAKEAKPAAAAAS
jgi:putative FmdB family regulatory protein